MSFEPCSKSMSPSFLELKTSSGLDIEDQNKAKALGQHELLVLREDDEPGRVGAASAGQNHVTAGL